MTYEKLEKELASSMNVYDQDLPGTTSRASMASSYSMKPKPFISLISVILPDP